MLLHLLQVMSRLLLMCPSVVWQWVCSSCACTVSCLGGSRAVVHLRGTAAR